MTLLQKKISISSLFLIVCGALIWSLYNLNSKPSISYSTETVQEAMKRDIVLIDIRRIDEWVDYGTIKGSHLITFFDGKGNYNVEKWLNRLTEIVSNKNQEFILVCAHANRTKVVARFLKADGYTNVHDLEGGINYGWIDKGLKTIPYGQ